MSHVVFCYSSLVSQCILIIHECLTSDKEWYTMLSINRDIKGTHHVIFVFISPVGNGIAIYESNLDVVFNRKVRA